MEEVDIEYEEAFKKLREQKAKEMTFRVKVHIKYLQYKFILEDFISGIKRKLKK